MTFVPDQGPVEEFATAGLHPPFHDRIHPWHADAGEHDLDPGVGEDPVEQGGELRVPVPDQILDLRAASSRSITRFRAAWVTQAAVGCAVVPRTRTRRVACSITARMY